jgi:hypothetical protein
MNLALRIGLPIVYGTAALATAPAPIFSIFLVDSPHIDPTSVLSLNAIISVATLPFSFAGAAVYSAVTPTLMPLAHVAWTYGSVHLHFNQQEIYQRIGHTKEAVWQVLSDSASAASSLVSPSSSSSLAQTDTAYAFTTTSVTGEEQDDFELVSTDLAGESPLKSL